MNTTPLTSTSQLTQYLLDPSLVEYTLELTRSALQPSDPKTPAHATKTARLALEFFTDILDPAIEAEKQHRDTFLSCAVALQNPLLAPQVLANLPPSPQLEESETKTSSQVLKLTAAQRVLELPDTLHLIMSHIPSLPRARKTLHAAALTSRSLHAASDLLLWSRPRDLDTVEQQVQFAFGVSISGGLSENLGNHVKRLRIRWMKGGWNGRLIQKIAKVCPGIQDLTIHWGDAADGPDPVTSASNATLHSVLSSLSDLRHLNLCKFSSTPEIDNEFTYPPDAHVPFSKLESLSLYGFTWYWPNIARGLGKDLRSLEIGLGTMLSKEQLTALSTSVPSLTTIRLSCDVELDHIQSFVSHAPGLEYVEITQYSEKEATFVPGVITSLTQLKRLKEVSFNTPVGTSQIAALANSPCELQIVIIKLQEGVSSEDCEKALVHLVKSKQQTLSIVAVSFEGSFLLSPSDAFVGALSGCPNLKRIDVDFASDHSKVSSATVDALLRQCPKLISSASLETLCEENALYKKEYKQRLDSASEEEEKAWEEDILGN